jgi:hypothetical protein
VMTRHRVAQATPKHHMFLGGWFDRLWKALVLYEQLLGGPT